MQFVIPSLGISQTIGRWTFLALDDPQLCRIEEYRLNTTTAIDHQAEAFGQIEAFYWHEKGSLHAIGSYADLDNLLWGWLRGKLLASKSETRCCPLYGEWEVAGMGNGEFRAVQTGPVLEVSAKKVAILANGKY